MIGMTSVTFRAMTAAQIIALAKKAMLHGIEWGGDKHVPPGELRVASSAAEYTRDAGLHVLSYGSYYRLLAGMDFQPVLDSAMALGAPMIRIWAGSIGSAQADADIYARAAEELRSLSEAASRVKISIGLEYHRNTLTDTALSAKRILDDVGLANVSTYWQPNPDLSHEDRLGEIALLGDRISNVHVFHWTGENVRHSLFDGENEWMDYIRLLSPEKHHWILEFVAQDDPDRLLQDANTLLSWMG